MGRGPEAKRTGAVVLERERAGHRGLDNKIQNSLAIKYKHTYVSTMGKGRRGGNKGEEAVWGGAVGSYPALLCTPLLILTPSLCVCGCVSGGLCTQFSSPLPQPSIPPPHP